jgi:hypothetical protein
MYIVYFIGLALRIVARSGAEEDVRAAKIVFAINAIQLYVAKIKD